MALTITCSLTRLLVALVGVFERNNPEKGAGLTSVLGSSNLFPDEGIICCLVFIYVIPLVFGLPFKSNYLVLLLVPPLQVAEQTVQVVHSPTLQSTEKKIIFFFFSSENKLFITRQTRPLVASVGFFKVEDSASSKYSFFEDSGTCAHLAPVLGLVKFLSEI